MSHENFFNMDDLSQGISRQLAEGIATRIFPGEQAMLSLVRCEANTTGSIHAHPQEQWGVCLQGSGIRIQDGVEVPFSQGDFWCTPGGVEHGIRVGDEGATVLDLFAPPRDEYRKTGKGFAADQPDPVAGCRFCHPKDEEILDENDLCLTLVDNFPVSDGHCLIIPKRHADTCFEMNAAEVAAMHQLLQRTRERLINNDSTITGFNTGMNSGQSAGQSILHAHMHVIPRRDGDQENPQGGVRNIFPDKAKYRSA